MARDSQQLDDALQAARAALGSPEAVLRVRAGLDRKLASGLTPRGQVPSAPIPLGKGVLLLMLVGGGAWLYAASLPQPSAAAIVAPAAVVARRVIEPVVAPSAPAAPRDEVKPELGARPAQRAHRASKLSVSAAAKPAARSEPELDVDAEIALIAQAQQRLRAQPAQALALLVEHAQRFPRGLLVQERETLRIDAERALGDDTHALEHARAFVARFPSSPQARPLARWLAGRASNTLNHKPASAAIPTH